MGHRSRRFGEADLQDHPQVDRRLAYLRAGHRWLYTPWSPGPAWV